MFQPIWIHTNLPSQPALPAGMALFRALSFCLSCCLFPVVRLQTPEKTPCAQHLAWRKSTNGLFHSGLYINDTAALRALVRSGMDNPARGLLPLGNRQAISRPARPCRTHPWPWPSQNRSCLRTLPASAGSRQE